jgi:hypothetical protein
MNFKSQLLEIEELLEIDPENEDLLLVKNQLVELINVSNEITELKGPEVDIFSSDLENICDPTLHIHKKIEKKETIIPNYTKVSFQMSSCPSLEKEILLSRSYDDFGRSVIEMNDDEFDGEEDEQFLFDNEILTNECIDNIYMENVEENIFQDITKIKHNKVENNDDDSEEDIFQDFDTKQLKSNKLENNNNNNNKKKREWVERHKNIGSWEQWEKGIGSKLLIKYGYLFGQGLGKNQNGINVPLSRAKQQMKQFGLGHCGNEIEEKKVLKKEENEEKKKRKREEEEKNSEKKTNVFEFMNNTLNKKRRVDSDIKTMNDKKELEKNYAQKTSLIGMSIMFQYSYFY